MTGDDFLKGQLAMLCWRVARSEGSLGMLAVALVLRNQVAAGAGDWMEQITRCPLPAQAGYPDVREPEFQRFLHKVDGVFDGTLLDKLTNGATAITRAGDLHPPGHLVANLGALALYKP